MTFPIIYADPAWNYRDKASAGKRGASHKYHCMTTEEICALPVAGIAAPNACLFLWATFPMLPDAFRVLAAWGFDYKTAAFVWIKKNRKAVTTDFLGMGNWTRSNAEVCLLGTRGRRKRASAGVRQVVQRPIGRHSEKPACIREMIVDLMGDLPRVELFARDVAPGWTALGNEIDRVPLAESLLTLAAK